MEAEKMKIVAVSALAVCVLGVGTFQFLKTDEAPKPASVEKPKAKADEEKSKGPLNPVYAASLNPRDPFTPAPFAKEAHEAALPPGTKPPAAAVLPRAEPSGLSGMAATPSGSLPPLPVAGPANGATAVPPGEAPEEVPTFKFRLTGVISGARPAAIFDDGDGHQRLVAVGGEIGAGATLLKVSPNRAIVRFAGDTLTLKPEAAPKAKASAKPASSPSGAPAAPSAPGLPGASLVPGSSPDLDAAARDAAKRLQGEN